MDSDDRKDLEWALKHQLTDLTKAHNERLESEAEAAEAVRKAKALAIERTRLAREAHMRKILAKHPDRYVVSLNGKRVVPGKEVSFPCPGCGVELPQILESVRSAMEGTFPRLAEDNFANSNGQMRTVIADYTCGKCGEHVMYRVVPIPY